MNRRVCFWWFCKDCKKQLMILIRIQVSRKKDGMVVTREKEMIITKCSCFEDKIHKAKLIWYNRLFRKSLLFSLLLLLLLLFLLHPPFFSFFSSFSSAPNGTLKIFTVQEGDEGSYQCVAENDKDMSVASGSLQLGGSTLQYTTKIGWVL